MSDIEQCDIFKLSGMMCLSTDWNKTLGINFRDQKMDKWQGNTAVTEKKNAGMKPAHCQYGSQLPR
jgi:hypothetical protein